MSKLILNSLILFILILSNTSFAQSDSLVETIEAETGMLYGGVSISNSGTGFTGSGFVTNFKNPSDKIVVNVLAPKKAYYLLRIGYRASNGNKTQKIIVNNSGATSVIFPNSSDFTLVDAGRYILNEGLNTITLQSEWGWIDVDYFKIYSTPFTNNIYAITPTLSNPNANQEAISLYNYLLSKFNKKIISGQTNDWFNKIEPIANKTPLLRAFDFQHYTQGYPYLWDHSIGGFKFGVDDDGQVQQAIDWYNSTNKTGLVNFQWHWHSPGGGSVGTNTFYTEYTTFDVTKAVISGSPENIKILEDIDTISFQLKRFQDAGVPVLWRPLHEAGGGWFWWGAKGAEACKQLYNIMYDRMTNYHHLNNLIWIWSTPENNWYPGNHIVDIVGHDSYPGAYVYDTKKNDFDVLYQLTGGKKLIAMTENGPIPNPDDCLQLDAPWSWFMSWSNLVTEQNSNEHIIEVYSNPNILTLENPSTIHEPFNNQIADFHTFPNPVSNILYFSNTEYEKYEIYNLAGNLIQSSNTPVKSISTTSYKNGIYMLRIYSEKGVSNTKFIIKK